MNTDLSGIAGFEGDESGVGLLAEDGGGGITPGPGPGLTPGPGPGLYIFGFYCTIYGANITIYGV